MRGSRAGSMAGVQLVAAPKAAGRAARCAARGAWSSPVPLVRAGGVSPSDMAPGRAGARRDFRFRLESGGGAQCSGGRSRGRGRGGRAGPSHRDGESSLPRTPFPANARASGTARRPQILPSLSARGRGPRGAFPRGTVQGGSNALPPPSPPPAAARLRRCPRGPWCPRPLRRPRPRPRRGAPCRSRGCPWTPNRSLASFW